MRQNIITRESVKGESIEVLPRREELVALTLGAALNVSVAATATVDTSGLPLGL